jgi:hypothetical protein
MVCASHRPARRGPPPGADPRCVIKPARSHAGTSPSGHPADASPDEAPWIALGTPAAGVLGAAPRAGDADALAWVELQLQPLGSRLSPDERLIAGQVRVDVYFPREQYERFDLLAASGDGAARGRRHPRTTMPRCLRSPPCVR